MNVIIAYSSITGNTELCADMIRETLEELGHEVSVYEASDAYPILLTNFDMIILGSPTYGYGDVTAQFEPFLEGMSSLDLSGKRAAVFGLGDKEMFPEEFCSSADVLEDSLSDCGALLVAESLKVDGNPVDHEDQIKRWAWQLAGDDLTDDLPA